MLTKEYLSRKGGNSVPDNKFRYMKTFLERNPTKRHNFPVKTITDTKVGGEGREHRSQWSTLRPVGHFKLKVCLLF